MRSPRGSGSVHVNAGRASTRWGERPSLIYRARSTYRNAAVSSVTGVSPGSTGAPLGAYGAHQALCCGLMAQAWPSLSPQNASSWASHSGFAGTVQAARGTLAGFSAVAARDVRRAACQWLCTCQAHRRVPGARACGFMATAGRPWGPGLLGLGALQGTSPACLGSSAPVSLSPVASPGSLHPTAPRRKAHVTVDDGASRKDETFSL